MSGRADCIFMGRKIGTFDGWDYSDEAICFQDFDSAVTDQIPSCDSLWINHETGVFSCYDSDGTEFQTGDIVPVLAKLPVEPKS